MKKIMFVSLIINILLVILLSCSGEGKDDGVTSNINDNKIKAMSSQQFLFLSEKELSKYTIVDVRTKEEYEEGHIKNSILKPVQEINSINDLSDFNKNKPVIVYCRTGNRSLTASEYFIKAGFNTYNLLGGITELIHQGYIPKQ